MNELYHHGVKGQKWGVRRTPKQLGNGDQAKAKQEKKEFKNDVKAYRKLKRSLTRSAGFDTFLNTGMPLASREVKSTLSANMAINRFVGQKKASRGQAYVNRIITKSNSIDRRNSILLTVGTAAASVAASAGMAFVKSSINKIDDIRF